MPTASDHVAPGRRALDDAAATLAKLRAEIGRVIIGQARVLDEVLICLLAGGHCLLRGVPGPREDAAHQDARRGRRPEVQPHPVHAGPDAVGHPRHRGDRRGRDDGQAAHPVHPRARLREHHPRRRDQPHAAATQAALLEAMQEYQVTVGGVRYRARAAAVRARDGEPDRAGRHASAARSAARSLHVQRRDRLSDGGRRAPHPRARRRPARAAAGHAGRDRRGARAARACSCATCPRRTNVVDYALRLVRATRPGDPTRAAGRARVGEVGRRPARGSGAAARRQGARAARRPQRAVARRRRAPSRCRCCAIASCSTSRRKPTASTPDQVVQQLLDAVAGVVDVASRRARPGRRRRDRRPRARRAPASSKACGRARIAVRFTATAPSSASIAPYRPGDDLKYLDWKLLARTDRLYTRQFRETTNMSAMLALDTSASMAFPDEGVSKFRYGVIVAAALAYLDRRRRATRRADDDRPATRSRYLPAKSGRPHLRTILARMAQADAGGRVARRARDFARGGTAAAPRPDVRALGFLRRRRAASGARWRGRAPRATTSSVLQILSRDEIEFPYRGAVEFEDLESAASRVVDAADDRTRLSRRGRASFWRRPGSRRCATGSTTRS